MSPIGPGVKRHHEQQAVEEGILPRIQALPRKNLVVALQHMGQRSLQRLTETPLLLCHDVDAMPPQCKPTAEPTVLYHRLHPAAKLELIQSRQQTNAGPTTFRQPN